MLRGALCQNDPVTWAAIPPCDMASTRVADKPKPITHHKFDDSGAKRGNQHSSGTCQKARNAKVGRVYLSCADCKVVANHEVFECLESVTPPGLLVRLRPRGVLGIVSNTRPGRQAPAARVPRCL